MSKTILKKVNGYIPCINSITRKHGLIASAVFGEVWWHCQYDQELCIASMDTIAKNLGLSRATIWRNITLLEKEGYIMDTTPDLKNHPHKYIDTGKANIGVEITATVADSNSTVAESSYHCRVPRYEYKEELNTSNDGKSNSALPVKAEQQDTNLNDPPDDFSDLFGEPKLQQPRVHLTVEEHKTATLNAIIGSASHRLSDIPAIHDYLVKIPEHLRGLAKTFCEHLGRTPIPDKDKKGNKIRGGEAGYWIKEFGTLYDFGIKPEHLKLALEEMDDKGLTIKSPQSARSNAETNMRLGRGKQSTATMRTYRSQAEADADTSRPANQGYNIDDGKGGFY